MVGGITRFRKLVLEEGTQVSGVECGLKSGATLNINYVEQAVPSKEVTIERSTLTR